MRFLTVALLFMNFACASGDNKQRVEKMYQDIKKEFPEVPELKRAQLKDSKVVIVDVREDKERAVSTLPGAISAEEYEANKAKYKDHKVAAYCTIGYRSAKYVKKLRKSNVEAYNLEGSLLGWVHSGGPVVTTEGAETKRVHVYGGPWNRLPEGYESVWP